MSGLKCEDMSGSTSGLQSSNNVTVWPVVNIITVLFQELHFVSFTLRSAYYMC
jgi:hypothetical protein